MDKWARDQATVKLVGRRKTMLERVAAAFAPGCSPVEAIDRALEAALAPHAIQDASGAELPNLCELVVLVDDARRADSERIEAAIAKLGDQIRGLHSLIEELAQEPD